MLSYWCQTSPEDIAGLKRSSTITAMQTDGVTECPQYPHSGPHGAQWPQYPGYPGYWLGGEVESYNQDEIQTGPYRARCNTWPSQPVSQVSSQSWTSPHLHHPPPPHLPSLVEQTDPAEEIESDTKVEEGHYGRRNPWGPYSYAQLITQAICSQPEQRMTLNQIYEFLISHYPYFAERRSHQKSAGWKVKL